MDSGFVGQSSPDSHWPQEVVSSGLGFREGCAGQTALRESTTVPGIPGLWSRSLGF